MSKPKKMLLDEKIIEKVKPLKDSYWTDLPTVRDLAKEFKTTQNAIIEAVESNGYVIDLVVGFRQYSGIGYFSKGDQRVEYVGD